jgi:hypothetical protein
LSTKVDTPREPGEPTARKGLELTRKFIVASTSLAILSGCTAVVGSGDKDPDIIPEQVAALAAPYQDVSTARLLPRDGCYWYLHEGPVETTLLPLRTIDGRPICAAREEKTAL